MNIIILAIIILILTKFLPNDILTSFGENRNIIICAIFVSYFILYSVFTNKNNSGESFVNFIETFTENIVPTTPSVTPSVTPAVTPNVTPSTTPTTTTRPKTYEEQEEEIKAANLKMMNIKKQRDDALSNTFEMQKIKTELSKTKRELEQIKKIKGHSQNTKKYYDVLKAELIKKGILDHHDIETHKIENENSIQELIVKMEKLKSLAKEKDMTLKKPEGTKCSQPWDESQQFNYLHSNNWSLPQKREPICHKSECKVCALDDGLDGFPVGKPPY